jgi:hypothetical protein
VYYQVGKQLYNQESGGLNQVKKVEIYPGLRIKLFHLFSYRGIMSYRFVLTILITVLLSACAPAVLEPMQSAGAVGKPPTREVTATSSSPVLDTQTVTPTNTATSTPTKEPFAGLSVCRDWRESERCPITENDFKKISEFVKANFKFPDEALRLYKWTTEIAPTYGNSFILLPEVSGTVWENKKNTWTDINNSIFKTGYSPIGQPYFFSLQADGSRVTEPIVVAVYPVKNSDGSIGTYSIIAPPYFVDSKDGSHWVDKEETEEMRITEFNEMIYCPPIRTISDGPISIFGKGYQGTLVTEVVEDLKNPNGIRPQLIWEFMTTGIIPEKMEEIPLLGLWSIQKAHPELFR